MQYQNTRPDGVRVSNFPRHLKRRNAGGDLFQLFA